MSNQEAGHVTMVRDENGRLIRIESSGNVTPEMMNNFILPPLIDAINHSIKELDATNKKYSERMEKLTKALVRLTAVLGALTIINILLVVVIHA